LPTKHTKHTAKSVGFYALVLSERLEKSFNSVEKKSKSLEPSFSRLLGCVSRLLELPPRLLDLTSIQINNVRAK